MNQLFSQHCASLLADLRNCLRGKHENLSKFIFYLIALFLIITVSFLFSGSQFLLDLPVYCRRESVENQLSNENSSQLSEQKEKNSYDANSLELMPGIGGYRYLLCYSCNLLAD
jgi:hypothetical protein